MKCYVYKWTHMPSLMWYVGSRTGKRSDGPDDGYVCGSKTVSNLIAANPSDWQRTIVAMGDAAEMYELETTILQLFDAAGDPRSFNRHNNHTGICQGGWNRGMKGLQTPWNKGLTGYSKGNQHARGMVPWNKGKRISDPLLLEKYRQGALRRHAKAKQNIQGE